MIVRPFGRESSATKKTSLAFAPLANAVQCHLMPMSKLPEVVILLSTPFIASSWGRTRRSLVTSAFMANWHWSPFPISSGSLPRQSAWLAADSVKRDCGPQRQPILDASGLDIGPGN
jgi:hypothetical protein